MISFVNFPSWISPFVFKSLPVRWYAVMYIVAFTIAYFFMRQMAKKGYLGNLDSDGTLDLLTYVVIGLIIGARLGSCLLYEGSAYYWTHPWMIFWPFRNGKFIGLPGMSYHGGVIGGIAGGLLFAKHYKFRFWDVADVVFASVPLGYTFGRLGNFFNGELWGRCTNSSYGMIFPDAQLFSTSEEWVKTAADKAGISYLSEGMINLPRHPSQLYEALFEGIVLFLIIWFGILPFVKKKQFGPGFISGSYLIGYGVFRFIIEYFREPDKQLGFIIALGKETEPTALFKSVFNISMGQILCFLMIITGLIVLIRSTKLKPTKYGKRKAK